MDEIAREAGVARSTVNLVFGNRGNLLLAVADDLLERGGFAELGVAFRHPDAREALRRSMANAAELYAGQHAVGMALLSLAATDGDAAAAARRLNEGRMEGMVDLAERLKQQGYTAPGVSVSEATDILWVITSIETFELLYTGRGLSAIDAGQRLVDMAERGLGIVGSV
jgi:AcrR family transcriptional regulator